MKISRRWICDFVDISDMEDEELARALTMAGFEVEGYEVLGDGIEGVIAAKVLSVAPHPQADKLHVLKVKAGPKEYEIICGDLSVSEGDVCPFAPPGARIKGGAAIEARKIRDVLSEGMLCSPEELGLEEKSPGVMRLNDGTPDGSDMVEALEFKDTLFEIAVTPNRGDVLSHLGMAREIAAVIGRDFKEPDISFTEHPVEIHKDVHIDNGFYCRRYMGLIITDIKCGESPAWMKARLIKMGLRPILNTVDITNYVLMELGQPLHAFDLTRLEGDIHVRFARPGEKLLLLDGSHLELTEEDLVIADEKGPVALAGVMGGEASAVDEGTVQIFLESAWFEPSSVRRTSRRYRISSESSFRFERKVDLAGVEKGLRRAAHLMERICGGKAARPLDNFPNPIERPTILVSRDFVQRSTGVKFSLEEMEDILKRLNFQVEVQEEAIKVSPPSYRHDVQMDSDVVEELLRIRGYDAVPEALSPVQIGAFRLPSRITCFRRVKQHFASLGFFETMTYIFTSKNPGENFYFFNEDGISFPVTLENPLSKEEPCLRMNLISGLVRALSKNHRNLRRNVALFEIGRVFYSDGSVFQEREHLGLILSGRYPGISWTDEVHEVDFFTVKGVVESVLMSVGVIPSTLRTNTRLQHGNLFHPAKSARMETEEGRPVAVFGELHPQFASSLELESGVVVAEIDMEQVLTLVEARHYAAREVPRFPPAIRDLSFVIDESENVEAMIRRIYEVSPYIWKVWLYDIYRGGAIPQGRMSVTFQIWFRSLKKTLSSEEISSIFESIIKMAQKEFNASLR